MEVHLLSKQLAILLHCHVVTLLNASLPRRYITSLSTVFSKHIASESQLWYDLADLNRQVDV